MKITALAGGVGGAKLAQGLAEVMAPEDLTIIVNTGDDFIHFGLNISPDLDTVCYTLAKKVNPINGWGIDGDTYEILKLLESYGGPTWFSLGDEDLATHLERTRRLLAGESLTEITAYLAGRWGIKHKVLPMTDDKVLTTVETVELGVLNFQEYFVKHRFNPTVKQITYTGIDQAKPSDEVIASLKTCDAIVICPSNPLLSIDPIINLDGVADYLSSKYVVCVSPIIQNKCIKGPLSKMLVEMGYLSGQQFILDHYMRFLNCIIIDLKDKKSLNIDPASGIITLATDIFLPDLDSRKRLSQEILDFLEEKEQLE